MTYTPTFYLLVAGVRWQSYLYDTARIVARAELDDNRGHELTTAVVAVSEEGASVERLAFLTDYQADRLRSGLQHVEVFGSASEAMERFARIVTAAALKAEGIPA